MKMSERIKDMIGRLNEGLSTLKYFRANEAQQLVTESEILRWEMELEKVLAKEKMEEHVEDKPILLHRGYVLKLLNDYQDFVNSTHKVVDFNEVIAHIFTRLLSGDYDADQCLPLTALQKLDGMTEEINNG